MFDRGRAERRRAAADRVRRTDPDRRGEARAAITHAATDTTGTTDASPTTQEQQQPSGPPKCTAADVRGAFGPGDSVYSGTHQVSIVATNSSGHTCSIYGYGGLELHTGGDGAVLALKLTREPKPAQQTVILAPGGKAYKKLLWAIPRDDDEAASCTRGASYAYVTLPDDTKTFEARPADGDLGDLGDICGDLKGYAWSATDQAEQG